MCARNVGISPYLQVDAFHSYCKPVLNPQLSEFCCSLTGISQVRRVLCVCVCVHLHVCMCVCSCVRACVCTCAWACVCAIPCNHSTVCICPQRQVDKASTFVEIFKCFEEWLDSKKLFSDHNFSLACDG